MYLECSCTQIPLSQWDVLMKGKRPLNYKWLVSKIKRELPELYASLDLNLFNPWWESCYRTNTHYILTHSAIEYFLKK